MQSFTSLAVTIMKLRLHHPYGIIDMDFLYHLNPATNLFNNYFLRKLISHLKYNQFHRKLATHIYKKITYQIISHLHIFSDTFSESLWPHKCFLRTLPRFHADIFQNAKFGIARLEITLAKSLFVVYQNQTIYVITGFKCDLPIHCKIRCTQGLLETGISSLPLKYITILI